MTAITRRRTATRSGSRLDGPTDMPHVSHITYDNFGGFLSLPAGLELDILWRTPSARNEIVQCSRRALRMVRCRQALARAVQRRATTCTNGERGSLS
ncbi:hypothetical protein BDA96_01G336700 [Sorghum bicolor]|uniref:CRIB domain-containing protein n=1 Tax=Sorghum bicolor TaxID=4558 RepID=A0A921V0R7_SORBI|nr:hypothetical protein BDA96_01G336700 [Sorghum bicolor]